MNNIICAVYEKSNSTLYFSSYEFKVEFPKYKVY